MSTNQIPDDALDAQLRNIMSAVGIGLAMFERSPPAMVEMRNALRAAVAALAPASSIPLTDARIREICLSHGYTIKPGQLDLKPYVFAAAREISAASIAEVQALQAEIERPKAPRARLTDEEIDGLTDSAINQTAEHFGITQEDLRTDIRLVSALRVNFVRAIEAAHGIGAPAEQAKEGGAS